MAGAGFFEDQVVTVFRSRRRNGSGSGSGSGSDYAAVHEQMESKARSMPGFVDFKSFTAPDGEHLSVITFATLADQHAWRDELSHRQAQQRGRDEFYEEYAIQVCRCTYVSTWSRLPG